MKVTSTPCSARRSTNSISDDAGSGWRLILGAGSDLRTRHSTGARNMAVDQALLESVQAGGRPVLRFYCWAPACLSFGRNQRARGVYDPARAAARGVDVVRRPTGGLAVLHDGELTYGLMVPASALGGRRAAYLAINRTVVNALRELGADVRVADTGDAADPQRHAAEPCFRAPAAGEIVAAGRKLVGSAQRVQKGVLLQHGSILLSGSQAGVPDLLLVGRPRSTTPHSATLAELLGAAPPVERLVARLVTAFAGTFGTRLAPETLTRGESARADALETHYSADSWTWRL